MSIKVFLFGEDPSSPIPLEHEMKRNARNEPQWKVDFPLNVTRMDNSLAMAMRAATLKKPDGEIIGEVSLSISGLDIVIDLYNENANMTQYNVDLRPIIYAVQAKHEEFSKVEQIRAPAKDPD